MTHEDALQIIKLLQGIQTAIFVCSGLLFILLGLGIARGK